MQGPGLFRDMRGHCYQSRVGVDAKGWGKMVKEPWAELERESEQGVQAIVDELGRPDPGGDPVGQGHLCPGHRGGKEGPGG